MLPQVDGLSAASRSPCPHGGWGSAKVLPAHPQNGHGRLPRGQAVWTQCDECRGPAEGLGRSEPSVNRVYCGVGAQGPRRGPTLLLVPAQDRGTATEGRAPRASRRLPAGAISGCPEPGGPRSPQRRPGAQPQLWGRPHQRNVRLPSCVMTGRKYK